MGQFLAIVCGNTLPSNKTYRQILSLSTQRKVKIRQTHSFTNIINHVLSTYWSCCLCKHNVVIHSEIVGKIKRALTDNVTKEYKEESKKKQSTSKR